MKQLNIMARITVKILSEAGAFIFDKWEPDQKVILTKNPKYWELDDAGNPLPYLDGIVLRQIQDIKTEFQEFDLGSLDKTDPLPPEFWERIITPDKKLTPAYQKYNLMHFPSMSVDYYGFLMIKSPLGTNKKLRQAFNYSLDRESIMKYVMKRGIPGNRGPVPPCMPNYNPQIEGYKYDPDKAKQLLAEAGYPNGEGLPEITLQLNSGGTTNERLAETIQQQISEITDPPLKIKLDMLAWPQHLETVEHGKSEFFRLGWIADYPDPENFLSVLYGPNITPVGHNSTRFNDPEYNKLYEQALSTMELEERNNIYEQMEKIVIEEAPWLLISYGESFILTQSYVHNYPKNPMRYPIWKYIWLEQH